MTLILRSELTSSVFRLTTVSTYLCQKFLLRIEIFMLRVVNLENFVLFEHSKVHTTFWKFRFPNTLDRNLNIFTAASKLQSNVARKSKFVHGYFCVFGWGWGGFFPLTVVGLMRLPMNPCAVALFSKCYAPFTLGCVFCIPA